MRFDLNLLDSAMIRLAKFIPELVEVFRRFPVPVVCCFLAFAISLFEPSLLNGKFGEHGTFGLATGSVPLSVQCRVWPRAKIKCL
jgi:hypothetical protein